MLDKAAVDLVAVSGQAAFLSHTVWWSECLLCHTPFSPTLTGLRDSFSCCLQPTACRALLSHSRGQDNCFDSSLQQCQRGELYSKEETAQFVDGTLGKRFVYSGAHMCTCMQSYASFCSNPMRICGHKRSYEKVCWFGGVWPLNAIFTAVSAPLF